MQMLFRRGLRGFFGSTVTAGLLLCGLSAESSGDAILLERALVIDEAGVLDPQMSAAITAWLESYRAKSGNLIVVEIVGGTEHRTADGVAPNLLAETTSANDRVILLVISPQHKTAAVVATQPLQSKLSKELAAAIVDRDLTQNYAADRLPGGILKSVSDILDVLDNGQNARVAQETAYPPVVSRIKYGWPLLVLFAALILVTSVLRGWLRLSVGKRLGLHQEKVDVNAPESAWWSDDLTRR
jgi:uncharacterized membrane protein YgcG